jgi:mono/diheme cytochrome c family protein
MKKVNQVSLIMGAGLIMIFSAGNMMAQTKPAGKPWPAPAADAAKKSPVKADDAAVKAGKAIYTQNCKSCHGVKGMGDGDKSKTIEISCGDFTSSDFASQSEGTAYWKVTQGRKPMPSFKDKLSDTERWQVVAYIRSLK